jgi:hypothetical protein
MSVFIIPVIKSRRELSLSFADIVSHWSKSIDRRGSNKKLYLKAAYTQRRDKWLSGNFYSYRQQNGS